MAERKHEDNEVWVHPEVGKIMCKDCEFREKDVKLSTTVISGATKGICEVYHKSPGKPYEILYEGGHCKYYQKED